MSSGWDTLPAGSTNVVMSPTAAEALPASAMTVAATSATQMRVARDIQPPVRSGSQCDTIASMRLGMNFGYQDWGAGLANAVAQAQEAERLGYDSVWTAEAYGTDSITLFTKETANT